MLFTVAICTWNRCDLLAKTLDRLTELDASDVGWELLVVENACTDRTVGVAREFEGRLPLRLLSEPKPGQSNARNCAVAAARGDYVVWTDDDVLVDAQWLRAYAAAVAAHPAADFFGGPIRPWFETPAPGWLSTNWELISGAYAARDFGAEEFEIDESRLPYGANFVVRRATQASYPYDPQLGLRHGNTVRGDESAVLTAMVQAGHAGWWVPGAPVEHFIPANRLTVSYLRGYYRGVGQVVHGFDTVGTNGAPQFFGRPRWLWRHALEAEVDYRVARLTQSSTTWVPKLLRASQAWGLIKGNDFP